MLLRRVPGLEGLYILMHEIFFSAFLSITVTSLGPGVYLLEMPSSH